MNKQDVLNYASEEIRTHQKNNYFQRGYRTAMRRAYDRVKQIDEPKKAVIPQSVADWLEVCKENLAISLFFAMTPDVLEVNNQSAEVIYWLKSARNQETFAKAWLYGYEVEKEKLYTARLKLISVKKYSYINREKDEKELFISDSDGLTDVYQTHFTQAELEELDVWNNPAFEIEEVEK